MYLHISLSAHCNKNLHFQAALPLFTVHYAQHGVHRQNTKHFQHIIDFEALPALIDLPQTKNAEADGADAGQQKNTAKGNLGDSAVD